MDFIREHADNRTCGLRWGVEPICAVLSECGIKIAPSTFYEWLHKTPSNREQKDQRLLEQIRRVHKENFGVYGARKVWLQLNRENIPVARCTVERLMRKAGLFGVTRGKPKKHDTGIKETSADDLVKRNFQPVAPNRLWVADITYVPTSSGWAYVGLVIDAYARRILGWSISTTMDTKLVLDALDNAIWTRKKNNQDDFTELVHHSDRGSQYTSIALTEKLVEAGIAASVGSVGSSYDNALAETINGLYKAELIKNHKPWSMINEVELATAEWINWYNNHRIYQYCGDIPPVELENNYYKTKQLTHNNN